MDRRQREKCEPVLMQSFVYFIPVFVAQRVSIRKRKFRDFADQTNIFENKFLLSSSKNRYGYFTIISLTLYQEDRPENAFFSEYHNSNVCKQMHKNGSQNKKNVEHRESGRAKTTILLTFFIFMLYSIISIYVMNSSVTLWNINIYIFCCVVASRRKRYILP